MNTDNVTRLEIIDYTKTLEDGGGRTVVFWDENKAIELSLQDNNRTLKIFIGDRNATTVSETTGLNRDETPPTV